VLKEAIGWDDAEFGWINFAFQLSYAAMFPFAGRLLDRVGVRNGLAIGVLVWSLAAAAHSFATTVLGFALARFLLGLGEATNFPACVKAVAEWFPRRQRSLATGIFNTGTNFGAMLQGAMMWLAVSRGWQAAFIAIGLLGFVWLAAWMKGYRSPEEHPRLSAEEAELIRSDQEPPAKALYVPWQSLLRYREAWAFCIGKMLTDPVWWFYLTWLPSYLQRERGVTLASAAGALLVIYLAADLGSVFGGWLPAFFLRRGWSGTRARLATMALFAAGLPISALGVMAVRWSTRAAKCGSVPPVRRRDRPRRHQASVPSGGGGYLVCPGPDLPKPRCGAGGSEPGRVPRHPVGERRLGKPGDAGGSRRGLGTWIGFSSSMPRP
jgi:ACS family hexuronate transporter-like MFS transporter